MMLGSREGAGLALTKNGNCDHDTSLVPSIHPPSFLLNSFFFLHERLLNFQVLRPIQPLHAMADSASQIHEEDQGGKQR